MLLLFRFCCEDKPSFSRLHHREGGQISKVERVE